MFNEVSLSGSDYLLVQLGSGSFETSGYLSTGIVVTNAASSAGSSSTSGFYIHGGNSTNVMSGQMILTLVGSNLWLSSHCGRANTTAVSLGGGSKTTSGVVDRVRITTTGASTFDAGSINIMYEG
jgi:hypothetical protein